MGCDIVTHSTTKYMDGHASTIGGAVVDSGNFDWDANAERFPGLCTPDDSYHGLTYTKSFGKMAYTTKLVAEIMRPRSIQSPHNAINLGTGESAPAYGLSIAKNAQRIAEFLNADSRVAWCTTADLKNDRNHGPAKKYAKRFVRNRIWTKG